jgi:hypothetical protein
VEFWSPIPTKISQKLILEGSLMKIKIQGFAGLLALLTMMLLAACSGQASPDSLASKDAPDFSLPAANGQTVSLSDYKGKQPVLLFFHMAYG